MDILTAARAQMELSLGFHMIFAALGIGMPVLMTIAEGLWLRTGQAHYRELARTWAKATAYLFAIGAVSGTALSFELGLLWPNFMRVAGAAIGPAFTLEAFAFFIEAIFLGLYLYGWERLQPSAHWLCAMPVALSGLASGVLVVAANAWMQRPISFDPASAFANPAWVLMAVHSSLSCYIAVGFAVAGVYAFSMLRGRRDPYQRSALKLAMMMGVICAILQPLSGHFLARDAQSVKLAAMEGHFETSSGAPLKFLGFLKIPKGLSWLAKGDADAVVQGLNDFSPDLWPNVRLVQCCFQVMVICGFLLIGVGTWFWISGFRRWVLRAVLCVSPLGFVALEAGWVVTEAGRQPWAIYGRMLTREAVTPVSHVPISFLGFTLLYLCLMVALVIVLRRLSHER